jgi:transposase
MSRPIDTAVRAQAVEAYRRLKAANPQTTIAEVASDHGVGEATLKRWLRGAEDGSVAPKPPAGGAKPKLSPDARKQVAAWVVTRPSVTIDEAVAYVERTFGLTVSPSTVRAWLREQGIGKRRLTKLIPGAEEGAPPSDHGANAERRRRPEGHPRGRSYPSDFTDGEWSVVEPIWRAHAIALPVDHDLREILDALRFLGASGVPWEYLPHDFPPHATVRHWHQTWGRDGTLTRVNDEVRRLLDAASGKTRARRS